MKLSVSARQLPTRIATGAYILHAGLDKWNTEEARAEGIHGMAAGAFPVVKDMPPPRFVRLLAAGEIATGTVLLAPFVPAALAGAALTGFSGALVTLYWRTPGMRKPGSIWPSQEGTAISKDVWMLGIGLGLLVDGLTSRRGS
jgi:hypothetical protein